MSNETLKINHLSFQRPHLAGRHHVLNRGGKLAIVFAVLNEELFWIICGLVV